MWFNSMQREEPYLGLTCTCKPVETPVLLRDACTGAAWLSSARVVRCWVKSRNERNPCPVLPAGNAGDSQETAGVNSEEGGDDVKSSCPLRPGLHTCYNGRYNGLLIREEEPIPKASLSSDWSLQPDSMKLESLVIADQHAAVNTFPGLVHTARHVMKVGNTRSRWPNPLWEGAVEGGAGDWDEVVTR